MPPAAHRTGIVFSPDFTAHLTGAGHPEQPARVTAIVDRLKADGLWQRLKPIAPQPAADEAILRCHTADYLRIVVNDVAAGRERLSTGDTPLSEASLETARLGAGGVMAVVDAVYAGDVGRGFAIVRPPGHHATPDRGMGFCLFNNVAIAARHAQAVHGAKRVLIADWDVHHGNGTQDIFYADGSVLFFDTHQSPLYPGTGAAGETGDGPGPARGRGLAVAGHLRSVRCSLSPAAVRPCSLGCRRAVARRRCFGHAPRTSRRPRWHRLLSAGGGSTDRRLLHMARHPPPATGRRHARMAPWPR